MHNSLHELLTVSSYRPIALVMFVEVYTNPVEECWWFRMDKVLNASQILKSLQS